MSIDTSAEIGSVVHAERNGGQLIPLPQWESLAAKTVAHAKRLSATKVFGKSTQKGSLYRWGVAIAVGGACDELTELLSRLASDEPLSKRLRGLDLTSAVEMFIDLVDNVSNISTVDAADAVRWAAAMPGLCERLESSLNLRLLEALHRLHENTLRRSHTYSPTHLILGGELGLTLAWRLEDWSLSRQLQKSGVEAVATWCQQDEEAIAAAITPACEARLVLASLIRCRRLIERTTPRRFKKQQVAVGDLLATWVAAMTTRSGGSAFSTAKGKSVADDVVRNGLLDHAVQFDRESLAPAIEAALGASQTGGRLAWEVCLPESMWNEPDSKLAIMLPEWDVRRGRTHIDYSRENVRIEVFAGRAEVIAGDWNTMIEIDNTEQQACGAWTQICEYTDDDVHYLELEQPWTGGLLLQRQIMLIREDRCVLFADAIVPDKENRTYDQTRTIRYVSRLPMASGIQADPEPETREIFLSDGKRRAMVIPLSASEWRVGETSATLKQTDDQHLLLSAQGKGRLYTPLWFDFGQRRFKRKRTWRQLTVADNLSLCRKDEAVGFRVQVGSEQWMIYRSLGEARCRSVLGKHLIADFFASRFDASDGNHDALVTVDDHETIDD